MTRAKVQFKALLDAFRFASAGQPMEHEAYLSKETGTIHFHSEYGDEEESLPDDIDDTDKYIAIPHKNELGLGKQLALDFASRFLPGASGQIQEIFGRSGAYARFKDLLEHRGLLQQWYEYEEKASQRALREWCEESGIEIDG